jgi:peroxiredoxin Q/BCP
MIEPGTRLMSHPLALGDGTTKDLTDYRGEWLVLYFYPKDSTPGCTTEGLDFNRVYPQLRRAKCEVLGVSRDSVKSHANFCAKQGFVFQLVSDADESLCRLFEVIKEKTMYGKKVLGIERSTFLVDPDGVVREAWRGVKVPGHADAVLAALTRLQS